MNHMHRMHTICILYAYYMHSMQRMHLVCMLYQYMHIICICSYNIIYMHIICILYEYFMRINAIKHIYVYHVHNMHIILHTLYSINCRPHMHTIQNILYKCSFNNMHCANNMHML